MVFETTRSLDSVCNTCPLLLYRVTVILIVVGLVILIVLSFDAILTRESFSLLADAPPKTDGDRSEYTIYRIVTFVESVI